MLYDDLGINKKGHLTMGGADVCDIAEEYGTALYVMDENKIRENLKTYVDSMKKFFPDGSTPLFASKALSFKGIYPIVDSEGASCDVVSPGEIFTALAAGFPAEKLYFHGNNKTGEDIEYAIESGVGCFIVDNPGELTMLDSAAREHGIVQDVLLRITTGIDPHTLKAINTGRIDSQFGVPIDTGQAIGFVGEALKKENLNVLGFHSHIGSEIFEPDPFCDAVDIMLDFAVSVRDKYGFTMKTLNLGGGFAVRYTESDPEVDIPGNIKALSEHLYSKCDELSFSAPVILMEPGRSIVANAGLTLYTAGGIKRIEGYRDYVTVDGGMTDNPRYALYKAPYTCLNASRMNDEPDHEISICGRCCESGDLIQENVMMPEISKGDIIAVLGTGAYNYSMSSNYNRLVKPGMVMIKDGVPREVIRRQTYKDLIACEI